MEYLIGAGITTLFFLCFGLGYRLGLRTPKHKPQEVDESTKLKAEQLKKDFESLMSYDIDKAMKQKKVI